MISAKFRAACLLVVLVASGSRSQGICDTTQYGTTTGAPNLVDGVAGDVVFTLDATGVENTTPGQTVQINVTTCSMATNFDTKLLVYSDQALSSLVTQNDDVRGSCVLGPVPSRISRVTLSLVVGGAPVYVVVTGYRDRAGHFGLDTTCGGSRISIKVRAGTSLPASATEAVGMVYNIPSAVERDSFKIPTDEAILDAMELAYGTRPLNVWLSESDDPNNLYGTNADWDEVKTRTHVTTSQVIDVGTGEQEIILAEKVMFNEQDVPATFEVDASLLSKFNISTLWFYNGNLTVSQELEYETGFLNPDDEQEKVIHYSAPWLDASIQRFPAFIQSLSSLILGPDQTVNCKIHATRMTVIASVNYDGRLTGCIATEWPLSYTGPRFQCHPPDDVLTLSGILNPPKIAVEQRIYVDYYAARTILTDAATNEVMSIIPAKMS